MNSHQNAASDSVFNAEDSKDNTHIAHNISLNHPSSAKDTIDTLSDIRYLCKSNSLITESLQRGCDITQLSNGDIIVTEVKIVNVQYSWDAEKNKMVRLGNSSHR